MFCVKNVYCNYLPNIKYNAHKFNKNIAFIIIIKI